MKLPNQQRTLHKLPPELRRTNFVTKHRLSMQIAAQTCKKRVPNVYTCSDLSSHFAYRRWWLGARLSGKPVSRTSKFSPLCCVCLYDWVCVCVSQVDFSQCSGKNLERFFFVLLQFKKNFGNIQLVASMPSFFSQNDN